MDALIAASEEEIESIPGIGKVVATSVYDFAQEERNQHLIERLAEAGVTVAEERSEEDGQRPLEGLTLVLTGKLDIMTRPEAEAALRAAGANVTSSVSKKTSAVIAGADAGSKADKAAQLGVPLLEEDAIQTLLAGTIPEEVSTRSSK
jgi:DNA ligase (NAD+)